MRAFKSFKTSITLIALTAFGVRSGTAHPFDATIAAYKIQLTTPEYEAFTTAGASGVSKYGGDVSYEVLVSRPDIPGSTTQSPIPLSWTVTLRGDRTMNAWALWSAEQTVRWLTVTNIDKPDEPTYASLKLLQSIAIKIEQVRLNPKWDAQTRDVRVDVVTKEPFKATVTSEGRTAIATGDGASQLSAFVGKRVIAKGYCDVPGTFHVQSVVPVRERTIELATMSLCPFGNSAVSAITEQLRHVTPAGAPIELSVRYLFSPRESVAGKVGADMNGKETDRWQCLHGKPEMDENLVQMAIRDHVPKHFLGYIEARSKDQRSDWPAVALSVGLSPEEIERVAGLIEADRDGMIQSEYDYVTKTLDNPQASPTFFWESQRVERLQNIPGFELLASDTFGSCAGAR